MKILSRILLLCLAICALPGVVRAQSTAFTYNGRLILNGAPVNGAYEMRFTLYDVSAGGNPVSGPLPAIAADVVNGLFTMRIDFGAGVFVGPPRWLSVEVRPAGGGAYMLLTPRQEVTSSPYSIRAQTAGGVEAGTVAATQLNTGGIVPAAGQFLSYGAGGLVWSDPGVAAGNIWSRNGADAYYNAGNVGIGTNVVTAGIRLEVNGATVIRPGNGNVSVASPNAELGLTLSPTLGNRADLRFDGTVLKLVAGTGATPPSAANGVAITTAGIVGMGTSTPAAGVRLEASGIVRSTRPGQPSQYVQLDGGDNSSYRLTAQSIFQAEKALIIQNLSGEPTPGVNNAIHFRLGTTANSSIKMLIDKDGRVGIGSTTPQSSLEVVGQDALRLVGYQPFVTFLDSNTGYLRSRIQSYSGNMVLEPESFINGSDPNSSVILANSGNLSVKNITIRGGADVAEPFEISQSGIAKGSVLIIDEEQPGKLKLSTQAYDTRVAGILSGANGVNPGISLRQEAVLDRGLDVALSGRVYVLADASDGSIKPGDLLTTSQTPGHAMKVADPTRSQGAILGKAMTGLKDGRGMVLVLVTLQ